MKNDKKSNNKDTFKKGRGKAIVKAVLVVLDDLKYSAFSYLTTRFVSGVASDVPGVGGAHATAFSDVGDVGHHSDVGLHCDASHGSHGSHDSSISDGEPGASEKDLSGKISSNSRRIRNYGC